MTKKLPVFILLILTLVLTGCGVKVTPEITSPIEKYAVFMSSVPGFPMDVELDIRGKQPKQLEINLTAENGGFLKWGANSKVSYMGESIEYTGETVYWTPFSHYSGLTDTEKITVTVTYMGAAGRVTAMVVKNIYKDKDGMYSFNKGD